MSYNLWSQDLFIQRDLIRTATNSTISNRFSFDDMDGDGNMDLVSYTDSGLEIYKSTGISIDSLKVNAIGLPTTNSKLVDWNNDGLPDVATIIDSLGVFYIQISLNLGNFEFADPGIVYSGSLNDIIFTDVNSDGFPDIVSYSESQIFILENQEGNLVATEHNFSYPSSQISLYSNVIKTGNIIFEDINGDGLKEMIFKSKESNIYIYAQTGNYDYTLQHNISNTDIGMMDAHKSIFLYDLNNDGNKEIICRSPNSTFRILQRQSGYEYTTVGSEDYSYYILNSSLITSNIALTDFYDVDNDGLIDIVGGNWVFFNNGDFTFNKVAIHQSLPLMEPIFKCADINNNGKTDICYLAMPTNLVGVSSTLYYGFYSHEVTDQTIANAKKEWYVWKPALFTYVTDFNGDGAVDLMNNDERQPFTFWENINDTLYPHSLGGLSNINGNMSLTFIDLNEDGLEDIILRVYNYSGNDLIKYAINTGTNQFTPFVTFLNANAKFKISNDLDGDGIKELFFTRIAGNTLYIYIFKLEDGAPTLWKTVQANLSFGYDNVGLRIGDIDLDGNKEIVIVNNSNAGVGNSVNTLQILKKNANDTYSMTQELSLQGTGVEFIGLLDVDGDLYPEIITTGAGKLASYKNNQGQISYPPNQMKSVYGLSPKGQVVDINNDGLLDIFLFGNVGTCINNGNGFTLTYHYPNQDEQYLRIADIDNDGDVDVLSTRGRWYENVTTSAFGVNGLVYYDTDNDGVFDPSVDYVLPYFPLRLNTGNGKYYTNINGEINPSLGSTEGIYSFTIDHEFEEHFAPTTTPYPVSADLNSSNPTENIELGVESLTIQEVATLDATLVGAKCNTYGRIHFNIQSFFTTSANATFKVALTPGSTFYQASLPTTVIGDTMYISLEDLDPFEHISFYADIKLPPVEYMGTTMSFVSTLNISNTEESYEVTNEILRILTCAYDPNEKELVYKEGIFLEEALNVSLTDDVEYIVHFQNTGNDTAQHVVIKDQLSNQFDFNTVKPISGSHPFNFYIDDLGRISVEFKDINLPDSTTNLLGSMGYIKFKLSLKNTTPKGVYIANKASIYFDENPPIHTSIFRFKRMDCIDFLNIEFEELDLCEYDSLIVVNDDLDLGFNHTWLLNDVLDTNKTANFDVLLAGENILNLNIEKLWCNIDTTLALDIKPKPNIVLDVGDTISICQGDTVVINSNLPCSWSQYGITYDANSSYTKRITYPEPIMVTTEVNGCYDTLHVAIDFKVLEPIHNHTESYYLPNTNLYNTYENYCPSDTVFLESYYGDIIWSLNFSDEPERNVIDTSSAYSFVAGVNQEITLIATYTEDGCTAVKKTKFLPILDSLVNYTITYGFSQYQQISLSDSVIHLCSNNAYYSLNTNRPIYVTNVESGVTSFHTFTSLSPNMELLIGCSQRPFSFIIDEPIYSEDTIFICAGSDFTYPDGHISVQIYENETYTTTMTSIFDCDSIVTIHLIPNVIETQTETINICRGDSYTYPDGHTIEDIQGNSVYQSFFSDSSGCDSVVLTTNLILSSIDYDIIELDSALSISTNATNIQWLDCISLQAIPGENNTVFTPETSGLYAAILGYENCSDTTECFVFDALSIGNIVMENIKFYPNPVNDNLKIELPNVEQKVDVIITDIMGKKVSEKTFINEQNLNLSFSGLSEGTYIVVIKTDSNFSRLIVEKMGNN